MFVTKFKICMKTCQRYWIPESNLMKEHINGNISCNGPWRGEPLSKPPVLWECLWICTYVMCAHDVSKNKDDTKNERVRPPPLCIHYSLPLKEKTTSF